MAKVFLDCTLRDGGYYNAWDFPLDLIQHYLNAMQAAGVDVVELGFRSLSNKGFKGACAYTTDDFLRSLSVPAGLTIGVMVNGNELVGEMPQREVLSTRLIHEAGLKTKIADGILLKIQCVPPRT